MATQRAPVFEMESIVCLKIDDEKEPGMVTGILHRPIGVTYFVTWAAGVETIHYAQELKSTELPGV